MVRQDVFSRMIKTIRFVEQQTNKSIQVIVLGDFGQIQPVATDADLELLKEFYYRWQKRLFELAKTQQEIQFAEVTPVRPVPSGSVAVTVRLAGAEADIHSGADAATVETVLRILKSC